MYSIEPTPNGDFTDLRYCGAFVARFDADDAAIAQRVADLLNRGDAERAAADAETPGPGRPCAAAMLWQQGGNP